MILRITNTGIQVNQELVDYINQRFDGIYFDEIAIDFYTFDNDQQEQELREKVVDVTYPGNGPFLRNTLCIAEDNLNQNIIDWLKTL